MKNKYIDQIRAATKAEIGISFDEVIFQKALGKAKRWMRSAFGSVDYEAFINDSGESISYYYNETLKLPKGTGTFNRETRQS